MSAAGRRPIDAALVYARRGWQVFPCHHPTRGAAPCSCGHVDCSSPAKHPLVRRGLHAASRDASELRSWWARWPRANVAVRTGRESGIVVVDVDPEHGGDATMRDLEAAQGPLPWGRTVRTGSGGRHLYFRHPGITVRNDAGRVLGAGVDIRGDGGYVIAPPSRHRSGGVYAVTVRGGDLPELPDWVLARIVERPRPAPTDRSTVQAPTAWARAALDGELERLRHATEGSRNDTLNRVAYRLGQIVGAGGLSEPEVEGVLIDQAISIGLREREAARTVRSGLTAGEATPRGPAAEP